MNTDNRTSMIAMIGPVTSAIAASVAWSRRQMRPLPDHGMIQL
jgi:hypothetical protein